MIPHFSFTEILLILFVVFVLFGAGKLPEVGRAGYKRFKSEERKNSLLRPISPLSGAIIKL